MDDSDSFKSWMAGCGLDSFGWG